MRGAQWAGIVAAGVLMLYMTASADAVQFEFANITCNCSGDAAIGEAQLFVDVTDVGNGDVLFTFSNIGPSLCSITDVYMDDGSLLGIASIINTMGLVEFSQGAAPKDLPGGSSIMPAFVADAVFSADSDPPVQPMGVNPGETLGISYSLVSGGTYTDVIDELYDGSLRIGIHVQGFESEGSEAFIHVPEPASLSLLALPGVLCLNRRRPLAR